MKTSHLAALLASMSLTGALLAACASDEADTGTAAPSTAAPSTAAAPASAPPTTAAPTTAAPTTAAPTTTVPAAPAEIRVSASDFRFGGLPAKVRVGTKLTLANESATELHELVAIKLPDTETRSVEELLQLPPEELEAVAPGLPAAVLVSLPNSPSAIPAVGDGTLTEPGRYAVICFIPTGVDPGEYLAAAQAAGGPPQIPGAGAPHHQQGMFAELIVE